MKKLLFVLIAIVTITVTSCKEKEAPVETVETVEAPV
jgi:hypothetical protein